MHLWRLLYCSAEHPWWTFWIRWHTTEGPWPVHNHSPHVMHHSVIPDSLEVLWGKVVLLHPNTPRQGGAAHQPCISSCAAGSPESHSLPVGHPFYLDITKVLILEAEKRSELPPPVRHPFFLSACMSRHTHWYCLGWPQSLVEDFFSLPRRGAASDFGMGDGGGEVLGVSVHLVGSVG